MMILEIDDLRKLARKRVPKMFFDYVDSGALTESTWRENESDFNKIKLRQRVAVDLSTRSLETRMLGQKIAAPFAIAPTGSAGMQHADGEILAARAAEDFGIPYTLSTMSICSIEDVAASTQKPFWFQLYVMKDRDFNRRLIDRAKAAGCSALVLTLDLQLLAQRHKDHRNMLKAPPDINFQTFWQFVTRPRWCLGMLRTRRRQFGNIFGHVSDVSDLASLVAWAAKQFDDTLSWHDVAWIREQWDGPLVLKGILDPDDALHSLKSGADALIVSNHGGRQLDGAPSSVSSLPRILDAVNGELEVHMDGGIRTGIDVFRARALGAQGVYIGRPHLYGLGALGQDGVTRCLEILKKELDVTMALAGERDIENVGLHNIAGNNFG